MKVSAELKRQVIELLESLPSLDDVNSQKAFVHSAGLDSNLYKQIQFGGSRTDFISLLIAKLIDYEVLDDGRHALEAVKCLPKINYIFCSVVNNDIFNIFHVVFPSFVGIKFDPLILHKPPQDFNNA